MGLGFNILIRVRHQHSVASKEAKDMEWGKGLVRDGDRVGLSILQSRIEFLCFYWLLVVGIEHDHEWILARRWVPPIVCEE